MQTKELKCHGIQSVYRLVEIRPDGSTQPLNRYRVRKRIRQNGKWTTHVETFDSFADAKAFARSNYQPSNIENPKSEAHLFSEAFDRFLIHQKQTMHLCDSTIHLYQVRRKHLAFFEPMSMNVITPNVIDTWLNLLADPEYLKTQKSSRIDYSKEYTELSAFFRYYRNYEDHNFVVPLLDRHRARASARSRQSLSEIRYMSAEEEMGFLKCLEPYPTIHDLALFQLHTGCRISEAAALDFKFVRFANHEVRIAQHLYWERKKGGRTLLEPGTKSGPHRVIPLTDECLEMLKRRKADAKSGIVFPDQNEEWLHYRSVQHQYDKAFKTIGIDLRSTHCLRHTFAVRFLDQTKDIYALQKILGHTDLAVTQVYAKYSNESVRRAFSLFRGGKDAEIVRLVPQLVPRASS